MPNAEVDGLINQRNISNNYDITCVGGEMTNFTRRWTQFALEAEYDHFGTARFVKAHNEQMDKLATLQSQLAASQERERILREGLASIISLDEDSGWTHEVSNYEQGIITGREEAACIARKACKAAEEVKC